MTKRGMARQWLGVACVGALAACGPGTVPFTQPTAQGGTEGTSTVDPATDVRRFVCVSDARFVYAVDMRGDVFRFLPSTLELTRLGRFQCPGANSEHVNSIAVDRNAVLWVNQPGARYPLYQVTLDTMACEPVSRSYPFTKVGMAFSANVERNEPDTLYLSNVDDDELYALDPRTLDAHAMGSMDAAGPDVTDLHPPTGCTDTDPTCPPSGVATQDRLAAELTGTGDGRLFALEAGRNPVAIAAVNRATGVAGAGSAVENTRAGMAWAVAFWGGDFWVFTATSDTDSQITRYRPSTDQATVVVPSVGALIVGAGVSTCVPPV